MSIPVAHRSVYADDPLMKPLIAEFVARIPQQAADLRDAIQHDDPAPLLRICHQLKGSGKSYGFEPISTHAAAANEKLRAHHPLLDALPDLHALLDYIEHIEDYKPAK